MTDNAQQAVAQAARALRDSAKEHKRASQHHRRAARKCMEELAELCKRFGITLSVDDRGGSHG